MSQQNVEIVRVALDAYNRGDREPVSSYLTVLRKRRMVKVQTNATTTRAMSVSVPLPDATATTAAATVTARRMYASQRGIRL